MRKASAAKLESILSGRKERQPLNGTLELTYRCNFHCLHCYCDIPHDEKRELGTGEWRRIISQIHKEGCLWLTFTGGEPLLRPDFLELYRFAKDKGFLVSIFTNGSILPERLIDSLKGSPPYSIEISLYATNSRIFESITGRPGSFRRVMENIERLSKLRVPLVLKTVGLKQNKGEILNVKSLAARKLGRYKFKFDSFIFPRINGDKAPCRWRLSPEEILAIENSDPDMLRQREDEFCGFSSSKRGVKSLYRCASWKTDFFINPYGRLQFCHLTDKFSVDLKKNSFNEGFYNEFPKLLKREFITGSRCQICSLRRICYHCPARAFLETKDEEAPVGYFCAMAKARHNAIGSYGNKRPRL